ncbi:hypothetical protein CPB86DRAFT_140239 [Serendipita vermifera]|nr:hypothetical protein CPB86DRAFT_140239 [Serendipita vermifera]
MLESTVVLSRAVSAPSYGYGAQSILRNSSTFPSEDDDSPQRNSNNVTFAPLPQTEMFGRRRKFSGKLGTQGRSGILNRQRQHPNGINYNPNIVENTSEQAAQEEAEGSGTRDNEEGSPANSTTNLQPPKSDLSLRRSASEDGTSTTTTNAKKSSGFKFWKKVSKRPALTTVPSQSTITPGSQLATTTPGGDLAVAPGPLTPEEVASPTRGFTDNEENQKTIEGDVSKISSNGHLSIDTITEEHTSPTSASPSIVITPSSAPTSPTTKKPDLALGAEDRANHSLDASDSVSSSTEVASTLESVEAMEISGHPLRDDRVDNTIPTANL